MINLTGIGHVGKEIKEINHSNGSFVTFSVGISTGTKAKPATTWVKVNVNSEPLKKLVLQYVKTGNQVYIEGMPKSDAYLNKEGKAVGTLEIFLNKIELLGKKDDATTSGENNSSESSAAQSKPKDDDDIPF